MKTRDEMYWARWLLLPCSLWALLLVVPCALSFIKRYFLQSADYIFWHNADFWVACLTGVTCGLAWVAITGVVAPSRKLATATLSCIPGGLLAWLLIGETYYRVDSGMGSQGFATYAPLHLCWLAGAIGLFFLWRGRRRSSVPDGEKRNPRRVLGVSALVLAGLAFCALVVPSAVMMWRFTLYHAAVHAITKGGEEEALRRVRRLAKMPLFDLDWTPGRILAAIPYAHQIDLEVFGCPSCRGNHTPLFHKAAAQGSASLLRQMLDWRGSPEYFDDDGQGALSAAIRSHDTNTVALLLSYGVKADATNAFFGGSLHQAVMTRAPSDLMAMLIDAGAHVNALTQTGMTTLDCANIWDPDAISFLLSNGASNVAVRVRLIPVPGVASQFRFEGTPFGIRLPSGFSPVNRLQTPHDCIAWEMRTVDRGSLSFTIGKVTNGVGTETNLNGFAAVVSHDEYDWKDGTWSAHGNIAFDTSGYTHAELQRLGRTPRYDALIGYMALQRRDLRRIQEAIHSIGKISESAHHTGARDGVTAAHDP